MQHNCRVQQQRQLRSLKRLESGRKLAQGGALEKKSKDLPRVVQDGRSYQTRVVVVTWPRSKADAFFFIQAFKFVEIPRFAESKTRASVELDRRL